MSKNVRELQTAAEFSELVSQTARPVVVDFWAPWCGPCRTFGPVLDEVAAELGHEADVAKVNVDEVPELAREYGVTSIPTVLYFAGGALQHREVGVAQKNAVVARVNGLAATA